ncbi:MAG: nucleotidyltransferase family protein [Deltaproteobacteria bacterium]|jgi:molybdenum cofactor cytidylyltransferase|nr:nucleotidyltransferase family protein [Deltaproteobacteria bacterium]
MSHQKQTAGIILAGGSSIRFGRPKQLLKLKGKYLLEYVLDAALESQLNHVVLVLGHDYQNILQALDTRITHERLQVVINHRYLEGQSRSLQAGLLKIRQAFSSVMFLLGDQPMLDSNTIDHMLASFQHSGKDICVPVCKGKRGNPTIFNRALYDQLMAIEGDIGARDIIRTNPERVFKLEIDDPLCFFDIDSQKDFENLQALLD